LFQIERTGDDWRESLELFWRDRPSSQVVRKHATALVTGTLRNMERIDAVISNVADKWTLERMGGVERNVLRLASQEILFMPDVPPKVAINEAVEVAKKFGTQDSGRFVNGVLDTIREMFERNEIEIQPAGREQEPEPDAQV
jgi:N utilization substance protein B